MFPAYRTALYGMKNMTGNDEIIFTGEYKGFRLGVRFDLSGKEPKDVAAALAYISEAIEPFAFKFSGIDVAAVEKLAAVNGKGIPAVIKLLEDKKPAVMGSPALNLCILVAPRALSLRIPLTDAAASL